MTTAERAILLAAILGAASACGEAREGAYFGNTTRPVSDPTTLYINGVGEPEYLDPALSAETLSAQYIHQMFEGLTVYGPKGLRAVQGVARAWDLRDDGRLYRFHLRPEARWSDGRPVTSHDFEYAWKRALRPATGARAAPDLYPLKNAELYNQGKLTDESLVGVHAVDDLTLEVELERPTPYFLSLTCRPAYCPVRRDVVEAFERRGEGELWVRPENIVTNGPYTLESWRFRYEITMKTNPHYWAKDALRIRRIVWLEIDSSWAAMNLYRTAEIDMLGGNASPAPDYVRLLEPTRDLRSFPLLMIYWYEFNTKVPPVDDPRVRRALDLAVDKRALVAKVLAGIPTHASHFIPENTGGGYAEQIEADRAAGIDPFAEKAHDPARARALLAEAGYEVVGEAGSLRAKGFPPLELLYAGGDEGNRLTAVTIQDMWRQHLGVTASLHNEEWKTMVKRIQEKDFQVVRGGWVADYNHPHTFLETFLSGSPANATGWADGEFDDLIARAASAADPAESIRLYRQAEQRALFGMSRMPLFFPSAATLVKPWVKGFDGNGRSLDLIRWLWIDPAWRENPGNEPASPPLEMPPPGRLSPP